MSFFRTAYITDWINIYRMIKDTQHKQTASGLNICFIFCKFTQNLAEGILTQSICYAKVNGEWFLPDLTYQNAFKSPTTRTVTALEIGWLVDYIVNVGSYTKVSNRIPEIFEIYPKISH